jgi:hypothetical protein
MTPRTLGRLEWWLASPWSLAFYRCPSGAFRWFAFIGPLTLWRRR